MESQNKSKLDALIKKWRSTVFDWGNDLGKVKTEAYQECADELELVLMEIRTIAHSPWSR